jgi:hypothetical protein
MRRRRGLRRASVFVELPKVVGLRRFVKPEHVHVGDHVDGSVLPDAARRFVFVERLDPCHTRHKTSACPVAPVGKRAHLEHVWRWIGDTGGRTTRQMGATFQAARVQGSDNTPTPPVSSMAKMEADFARARNIWKLFLL